MLLAFFFFFEIFVLFMEEGLGASCGSYLQGPMPGDFFFLSFSFPLLSFPFLSFSFLFLSA